MNPFNPKAVCPKCNDVMKANYCRAEQDSYVGPQPNPERIERFCGRCGYRGDDEACLDSLVVDPPVDLNIANHMGTCQVCGKKEFLAVTSDKNWKCPDCVGALNFDPFALGGGTSKMRKDKDLPGYRRGMSDTQRQGQEMPIFVNLVTGGVGCRVCGRPPDREGGCNLCNPPLGPEGGGEKVSVTSTSLTQAVCQVCGKAEKTLVLMVDGYWRCNGCVALFGSLPHGELTEIQLERHRMREQCISACLRRLEGWKKHINDEAAYKAHAIQDCIMDIEKIQP